ncbi:MAG: hypothetical protein QXQ37_06580 [Nitrososphaerota archaeon]
MMELMKANVDIVALFNEEERRVYEELKNLIIEVGINELHGRYKIAKYVHDLYVKQREEGIYGKKFFSRLAKALGFGSESVLREMYIVVEKWPTLEAINNIVAEIGQINWKQLVLLSKEENPEELIKEIKEGKSLSAIMDKRREKLTDSRGRKPIIPENLNDFVGKLSKNLQQLLNKLDAWKEFDIIDNLPEDGEQFLEKFSLIVEMINSTIRELEFLRNEIKSAIQYVRELEKNEPVTASLSEELLPDEDVDEFEDEEDEEYEEEVEFNEELEEPEDLEYEDEDLEEKLE